MTDPYLHAITHTWPAAKQWHKGGWRFQDGAGGGKRVSAAMALGAKPDWGLLETEMPAPLVMVRSDQKALDQTLQDKGFRMVDPTVLYACDLDLLALDPLPPAQAYATWPPLHASMEIWEEGGVDAARRSVMARVPNAKTALLIRNDDSPASAAFVALSGPIAMIHAIEVHPNHRRQGVGRKTMIKAAHWAVERGASRLALAVRKQNSAARALYTSFGMDVVGQYHYRARGDW